MAIRIRQVNGVTVALCAAESHSKSGDIYLDDAAHHALTTKFGLDFRSMGFMEESLHDEKLLKIMEEEKRQHERVIHFRKDALATIALASPIAGNKDNVTKTMLDMTDYVLELTKDIKNG